MKKNLWELVYCVSRRLPFDVLYRVLDLSEECVGEQIKIRVFSLAERHIRITNWVFLWNEFNFWILLLEKVQVFRVEMPLRSWYSCIYCETRLLRLLTPTWEYIVINLFIMDLFGADSILFPFRWKDFSRKFWWLFCEWFICFVGKLHFYRRIFVKSIFETIYYK